MAVSLGSIIKIYERVAPGSSRGLPPKDMNGDLFPGCVFVSIGKCGF